MKAVTFLVCLLFAIAAQAQDKASIEQCAAWYKKKKSLEANQGGIKNRERIREISSLQKKYRCPTRHNQYYD